MTWTTTSVVLEKLHDYDERTAWTLLVEHYRDLLVRYARRSGLSAADAQDAAQEALMAFAEAYRAGRYSRERGRLKHWLFGIARRQILSVQRRGRGPAALPPEAVDELAAASDPLEQVWEEEWQRTVFERAIEQVRSEVQTKTFEIFRLSALEQWTTDRIAGELEVATTQVYNAKHRVMKRLSELVGAYEDA